MTGQAQPATRGMDQAIFTRSILRRGEIGVLVYATGGKTYSGQPEELVQSAVTVSHF